ncbi:MAG: DUF2807 domain-containing protein [Candidatus Bathyarchaeota archaeon]|nr:MAG: DUF2807 domain-containing protein [Candidatus Bathyarchaeota archaeon]
MNYCRECGTENKDDSEYCRKCGAPLREPRQERGWSARNILPFVLMLLLMTVGAGVVLTSLQFGNVTGSGTLVTQEKNFSDFTIIRARMGFQIEIAQSKSYSVKITTDDNVIDDIQVTKQGETLTIGLKPRTLGTYRSVTLKAEITMPDLSKIYLSSGTTATAKGFRLTHDIELDLSSGSSVKMEGSANNLTIDASSGSNLDLSEFRVHNANVELSGGSSATINLDGRLDADLSSGSTLYYIGDPTLGDIETSGGSTVKKIG